MNHLQKLKKTITELKQNAEIAYATELEGLRTLYIGRYFAYDRVLELIDNMEISKEVEK